MKQLMSGLLENDFFIMLMNGVVAYTALSAVIITVLQVPSEAILDSGLDEILMVFEEFPD